jgi:endoglucanase
MPPGACHIPKARNMNGRRIACKIALALAAATLASAPAGAADDSAFAANKRLARGINLGNALEAPSEGAWGVTLEDAYFQWIAEAGFNSVRLPVNWAAHAEKSPPYAIHPAFAARVDWAIETALKRKLAVVVNIHHYEEMFTAPDENLQRCLGLWKQIAERYRHYPDQVVFELLNEPHDKLDDDRWNAMIPQFLGVIRPTNPRRAVIIGPGEWNSIKRLDKLRLPESDRAIIATVHYYLPFHFTHQSTPWIQGSEQWTDASWTGAEAQRKAIDDDFQSAARWGREHNRPIYLGEFGAFSKAPLKERVLWTRAVVGEAEKLGMSWSYWEFASGFGAFDPHTRKWRPELLEALIEPRR